LGRVAGRGTDLGPSRRAHSADPGGGAAAGALLELPPQLVKNVESKIPMAARMRRLYVRVSRDGAVFVARPSVAAARLRVAR
jgi:hypothetical protein